VGGAHSTTEPRMPFTPKTPFYLVYGPFQKRVKREKENEI